MSDVFISYARRDLEHARSLATALALRGWSVWWDRDIPPGASFDDTIEQALAAARCVIVLWSRESLSSRWVRTEASEGLSRDILVPVLLERVVPPLEFRRVEAADLSDWMIGAPHPELDALIRSVGRLLGDPKLGIAEAIEADGRVPALGATVLHRRALVIGCLIGGAAAAVVFGYAGWTYVNNERHVTTEDQLLEAPPITAASDESFRVNLLAESNGARLVEAPAASWAIPLDENSPGEFIGVGGDDINAEAIYAFKGDQLASFDRFEIFVPGTASETIRDFELLGSNDLAPESFRLIGRFQVRNMLVVDSPYQRFTFPSVTARYLKFRLISSYHGGYTFLTRFRLLGTLDGSC